MPPSPPEQQEGQSSSFLFGRLLPLIVLIGVPVWVVSGLLNQPSAITITPGSQPGGRIHGRVMNQEGVPIEGAEVRVAIVPSQPDGTAGTTALRVEQRSYTSDDGSFVLAAAAVRGHYLVSAAGDLWVRSSTEVSWFDKEGQLREPDPVELRLEPGCMLRLEILDSDGEPSGRGKFDLTGMVGGDSVLGLGATPFSVSGHVVDGVLEYISLPPMEARIVIQMDDGRGGELKRQLEPGLVTDKIQL